MSSSPTLPRGSATWSILLFGMSCVLLVLGLVSTEDQWGVALSFAGGGAAAVCLIGILLAQPAIAFVGAVICIFGGMVAASLAQQDAPWASPVLTAGLLGLVGLVLLGVFRMLGGSSGVENNQGSVRGILEEILKTSMLSDNAKRILFREREMKLLRQTIEDDIERGDFNAGLVLCRDLDRLFGYTEEAEQLQHRVLLARNSQLAAKIEQEVEQVTTLLDEGRLQQAEDAAERLQRMYPDSPAFHGLEARIRGFRQQLKRDVKAEFLTAADRGESQLAMEKLRELDHILGPDEVAELHAVAADIIGQHRQALSVQFKMAISDHRWAEAIATGTQIIADFPNSRVAIEVRGMLDHIRVRAEAAGLEHDS